MNQWSAYLVASVMSEQAGRPDVVLDVPPDLLKKQRMPVLRRYLSETQAQDVEDRVMTCLAMGSSLLVKRVTLKFIRPSELSTTHLTTSAARADFAQTVRLSASNIGLGGQIGQIRPPRPDERERPIDWGNSHDRGKARYGLEHGARAIRTGCISGDREKFGRSSWHGRFTLQHQCEPLPGFGYAHCRLLPKSGSGPARCPLQAGDFGPEPSLCRRSGQTWLGMGHGGRMADVAGIGSSFIRSRNPAHGRDFKNGQPVPLCAPEWHDNRKTRGDSATHAQVGPR